MAPSFRRSRRAAISFERATAGDVTSRDSAAGDIYHDGADPDHLLQFLRDYVFLDEQRRELRQAEMDQRLDRIRDEVALYRSATRESVEALRQDMRRLAWAVAVLTVLLLFGFVALAWLLYDRYAGAALLRAWLGAGAGVLYAFWRPHP